MDDTFSTISSWVSEAPEMATLIIVILIFGKNTIKKTLFKQNGKDDIPTKSKNITVTLKDTDEYVKRKECHKHIEGLKTELSDRINEFKTDMNRHFDQMIKVIDVLKKE